MLGYLQQLLYGLDGGAMLSAAIQLAAVFLCLTVHETCHGLAAYALGDPTAKERHRLSLNPLRHIDWFGLAMMFVAGFGWAKPVPVDPRYFKNPKLGMALTALAGPASNFVLAALLLYLRRFAMALADGGAVWAVVLTYFLTMTALLSIGLGLFNLLPIPPLDGSKVAAAVLPDTAYVYWMRFERLGMLLLLGAVLLGWQMNFLGVARNWVYYWLTVFAGYLPPWGVG